MKNALSIALLIAGIILICAGINAWNSLGSGVSRLFTGAPTDRTLWLLVSGVVLAGAGLFGLKRGSRV